MADDQDASASQNENQSVANQQPGAKIAPKRDPVITARDELLARMDEQIMEARGQDDETFFQTADPRALAMAAEMGREARGEPISTDRQQGRTAASGEQARPVTQEADPAEAAAAAQTQIDASGNDPLEEFIVREHGKPPMFKTVVNGQVKLVPLANARTQLQKHLAADIRWEQMQAQQRQLDERARQLAAAEAKRAAQPVVAPVSDAELDQEAANLVRSLLSDPEQVAAKKVSQVLQKVRQAATPQIDVSAVAAQAANVARQTIAAEDNQRALATGLQEFTAAYPDIAQDSDLFALADRKTTAIAAEHPDWGPKQVMLEAGRQTREWVAGIAGKPANVANPKTSVTNSRQALKQNLRPMPQASSARVAPARDASGDGSPQDALAEIRKARGQAY